MDLRIRCVSITGEEMIVMLLGVLKNDVRLFTKVKTSDFTKEILYIVENPDFLAASNDEIKE